MTAKATAGEPSTSSSPPIAGPSTRAVCSRVLTTALAAARSCSATRAGVIAPWAGRAGVPAVAEAKASARASHTGASARTTAASPSMQAARARSVAIITARRS